MKNTNVEELKEYYEKKLSEVNVELLLLKKGKNRKFNKTNSSFSFRKY